MRLPIDPSVIEFDVYGSAGRLALSPRQTQAVECFGTLLDELAAMIRSGAATHPCDVRRGVHLQGIIEQVGEKATADQSGRPAIHWSISETPTSSQRPKYGCGGRGDQSSDHGVRGRSKGTPSTLTSTRSLKKLIIPFTAVA